MEDGRTGIRLTQEKLNSSLTTPIVDKEIAVLEKGSWLNENKDLTGRFNLLPPISPGNVVKAKSQAFTVN